MSAKAVVDAFPIALQRDVRSGSVVRSQFRGVELIIWRDDCDGIHVWEDRCPHRSVRLSAGRNLGDGIQAAYHGWKFGKDGSVVDIPAERHSVRADIRVKTFPCAIGDGFVWIGDLGKPTPPKALATIREDAYLRPLYIDAPAKVVTKALPETSDLQLWVTPCDDNLSLVMGYTLLRSTPDATRCANNLLDRLRRAIEASGRP
jgi:nitrite reductase/ring-hydroxylating ferredoxin subunit